MNSLPKLAVSSNRLKCHNRTFWDLPHFERKLFLPAGCWYLQVPFFFGIFSPWLVTSSSFLLPLPFVLWRLTRYWLSRIENFISLGFVLLILNLVCLNLICHLVGRDFSLFVGLRYPSKKRICLTPSEDCLLLASSEIIAKIIISKLHSASVNYVKITINGVHVFFCNR